MRPIGCQWREEARSDEPFYWRDAKLVAFVAAAPRSGVEQGSVLAVVLQPDGTFRSAPLGRVRADAQHMAGLTWEARDAKTT